MDPELYDALDGQVALVTGANRGMGADTIVWLSRFGLGSPAGRFWRDRAVIDW